MQKMTDIAVFRVVSRIAYYASSVAFLAIVLLTDVGNYFHGGTPLELIALQVFAVLIVLAASKLFPVGGRCGKILVLFCAAVPAVFIVWSLISVAQRVWQ